MWTLLFFKTDNGIIPAKEFLNGLNNVKLLAKMIRELELLEEFGIELKKPHIQVIKDVKKGNIYELRAHHSTNIARIFFFYIKGNKIILLHGIVKKQNKTPKNAIIKAFKYKKQHEKRNQ